ncbi:1865_t:CDS:2, partial [Funneliformis geosporum]
GAYCFASKQEQSKQIKSYSAINSSLALGNDKPLPIEAITSFMSSFFSFKEERHFFISFYLADKYSNTLT